MAEADPIIENDFAHMVRELAVAGREAQRTLARLSDAEKAVALREAAAEMRAQSGAVLEANALDLASGKERGLSSAMLDRLLLDEERLESVAQAIEAVAALPDPDHDAGQARDGRRA